MKHSILGLGQVLLYLPVPYVFLAAPLSVSVCTVHAGIAVLRPVSGTPGLDEDKETQEQMLIHTIDKALTTTTIQILVVFGPCLDYHRHTDSCWFWALSMVWINICSSVSLVLCFLKGPGWDVLLDSHRHMCAASVGVFT